MKNNWKLYTVLMIDETELSQNCLIRLGHKRFSDLLTYLDVPRSCHEESFLTVLFFPSIVNARCHTLIEKINNRNESIERVWKEKRFHAKEG